MAARGKHIIQRQVFELSAAGSGTSFDWDDKASGCLHRVINPGIEACFTDLIPEDQHLIIDTIEIDLGVFAPQDFEKDAGPRLREILSGLLQSYVKAAGQPGSYHRQRDGSLIASGETPASGHREKQQEKEPMLASGVQSLHMALLYFLQQGSFPWWHVAAGNDAAWMHANTLDESFPAGWMASLHEAEKAWCKDALRASAAARMRMANHFSAGWMSDFLDCLGLAGSEALRQFGILSSAIGAHPAYRKRFHQFFWMAWIAAAFTNVRIIDITVLVQNTAGAHNDTAIELAQLVYTACSVHPHDSTFAGYAATLQHYMAQGRREGIWAKQDNQLAKRDSIPVHQPPAESANMQNKLTETISSADPERSVADGSDIFMEAAGIVILTPFLSELLTETGLWDGEKWCTEESVYRSVQLLSWLVFGEADLPEYRLLLMKVCCGLEVDAPLPANTPLLPKETDACAELLNAVIRHWKALRSTGAEGLQQAFLQREGKLSQHSKGYQLVVERKAQDVLLSHLPWSYSMVRLPWMEQVMYVTWI